MHSLRFLHMSISEMPDYPGFCRHRWQNHCFHYYFRHCRCQCSDCYHLYHFPHYYRNSLRNCCRLYCFRYCHLLLHLQPVSRRFLLPILRLQPLNAEHIGSGFTSGNALIFPSQYTFVVFVDIFCITCCISF